MFYRNPQFEPLFIAPNLNTGNMGGYCESVSTGLFKIKPFRMRFNFFSIVK
jgi:hypothetical protein